MPFVLCLSTALAAIISILTPGPGMLALFATVAAGGRREGLRFFAGEIAGDLFWSALALAAILGVSSIGPRVSAWLGLCCGLYLIGMGLRALAKTEDPRRTEAVQTPRSFRTGLVLGMTNPKSYPVFIALFGVALSHSGEKLSWPLLPLLMLSVSVGFVAADAVLLLVAGLPVIRTRFLRHRSVLTRGIGLAFVAFGGRLTVSSVRDLTA